MTAADSARLTTLTKSGQQLANALPPEDELADIIREAVSGHNDVDGVSWIGVARDVAQAVSAVEILMPAGEGAGLREAASRIATELGQDFDKLTLISFGEEFTQDDFLRAARAALASPQPAVEGPIAAGVAEKKITDWLEGRIEAAIRDSEAQPYGHGSRSFYSGQAAAYGNALSLVRRFTLTPPADPKPTVPGNDAGMREGRRERVIGELMSAAWAIGTAPSEAQMSRLYKACEGACVAIRSSLAPQTGSAGEDEPEKCFACGIAFKPGDMVINDITEGTMHRDCAGPERESFVDPETEEPIGPDAPIPAGYPWHHETPPAPVGEDETGVREALETANVELCALVLDPNNPDFGPACPNPADAECLTKALSAIRAALANQPPKAETPAGVGGLTEAHWRFVEFDVRAKANEYEFKAGGDYADHTPTEFERVLLEDFGNSLANAIEEAIWPHKRSAAPAARPGDGVERYMAGAMDMRDRAADAINALMHRMSADGLSSSCQAVLCDATLMVRDLRPAAAPAADGGRA